LKYTPKAEVDTSGKDWFWKCPQCKVVSNVVDLDMFDYSIYTVWVCPKCQFEEWPFSNRKEHKKAELRFKKLCMREGFRPVDDSED
jgi:ssDNA-binding Zn-finger/Zn-ribbon topoisomerase 1